MNLVIKARINLLQKHPFFGRLALLLDIQESKDVPTMCTDGETLFYNQDFVKSLTSDVREACVLHEVLHVALGHLWRRGERYPHIFNCAADYAINGILIQNGLQIAPGMLHDTQYSGMSAEQIYDKLMKNSKMLDCGFHMETQMGGSGGEGEENQDGEGKDGKKKGKGDQDSDKDGDKDGKGKPKSGKGKNGCDVCKSHAKWAKAKASPKKARQIKKKWDATMEQVAKERGTVPAGFERIIEDMKPREDWKKILVNYLSSSKSDFDFTRRDRRTLDWPFYIPDLQDTMSLENIVVAIDTSGSIGTPELNSFVSEVKEILRLFPKSKGWLIDCDAEVNQFVEIEKAKEPKLRFYGGGGTSHRPVFTEITKRKIKPKVMIAFTDLYTDFPDKKPDYPVLWLATPGASQHAPFGRIIQMKEKFNQKR